MHAMGLGLGQRITPVAQDKARRDACEHRLESNKLVESRAWVKVEGQGLDSG